MTTMTGYKTIVHLAGAQIVPNYVAIRLCGVASHMIVTTSETRKQFDLLSKAFNGMEGLSLRNYDVPSTDYPEIKQRLLKLVEGVPFSEIQFNITGGTKLMSLAALDVCREFGIQAFYIDTQKRKIHFLNKQYEIAELPPVFNKVEDFLALSGYQILQCGKTAAELLTPGKRILLRLFWQHRDLVRNPIRLFAEAADKQGNKGKYNEAVGRLMEVASHRTDTQMIEETWPSVFGSDNWKEGARFGAGGWFEEWMLMQFVDCKQKDRFLDLQVGLKIISTGAIRANEDQELDLAFTDGYQLYIIECKAGQFNQEPFHKLENLRQSLGGVMGRGVLCSLNEHRTAKSEQIIDRVSHSNFPMVTSQALPKLPESMFALRPGKIYQTPAEFQHKSGAFLRSLTIEFSHFGGCGGVPPSVAAPLGISADIRNRHDERGLCDNVGIFNRQKAINERRREK